ncbi:hypothetical protein CW714_08880 [Methanophagales archaeon]|nr:MAG: hypothetical protein CW714_08880 [Methanophagales archaeon]
MRKTTKIATITVLSLLIVLMLIPSAIAQYTLTVNSTTGVEDENGDKLLGDGPEEPGTDDLVHLIDASDGSLICEIRIGEGVGPPFWNQGMFEKDVGAVPSGTVIYCRAWNNDTIANATYYGDSDTYTVQGVVGEEHDFGTWSTNQQQIWDSYNDSAHNNQDDTFGGDEHTVYMHGTGFATAHEYKVAYYDAPGDKSVDAHKIEVDTVNSDADGKLSSDCLFTSYQDTADPGTWHAIVYEGTDTAPSTYDSGWSGIIKDDSFTVEESAIPEFPTVIAAIAVSLLCAGAYMVMRRGAGKR